MADPLPHQDIFSFSFSKLIKWRRTMPHLHRFQLFFDSWISSFGINS